jgi:flagellar hook-length control protein FliK
MKSLLQLQTSNSVLREASQNSLKEIKRIKCKPTMRRKLSMMMQQQQQQSAKFHLNPQELISGANKSPDLIHSAQRYTFRK